MIPSYVDSLQKEISSLNDEDINGIRVKTIYLGGGTPSLLPARKIGEILDTLDARFDIVADPEISLEANPGTLSSSFLKDIFLAGINRLSLGMQSANPIELVLLERQHCLDDVFEAVNWTRQAGINNLSLDLIFGLPEQTIDIWTKTLSQALSFDPEHLSLYALSIEQDTPMHAWLNRGLISLPEPDLAADMYELASVKLTEAGYVQYEISNWAKENSTLNDLTCRHNLQYWRNRPYFGFGAGAHGYVNGMRSSNVLSPTNYILRLNSPISNQKFPRTPATSILHLVSRKDEMMETMMMGLRLTQEGISKATFKKRFNKELNDVFKLQIKKLIRLNLLEWVGPGKDVLRLTPHARMLGNNVFREFV